MLSKFKRRWKIGGKGVGEGTRMTACPQTSIFELSVRWWTGNTDWLLECECQSKSVSREILAWRLARRCGGRMCLYLDSINVLRNANVKINLKEEQKHCGERNAVWQFGLARDVLALFPTGHLERVSQAFRKRSERANSYSRRACVLVVYSFRYCSIWLQRSH